jgi:hypothetical protein
MVDRGKRRLRLRHALAGVGILALLVGFSQVWTVITLTTGQQVSLTGTDQATLAVSLLLVAAAAHALSLLVYRGAHLVAVIVHSVSAGGALWAIVHGLLNPLSQASAEITLLTGLSGQDTVSSLVAGTDVALFPVGTALSGAVCMLIAGVIGLGLWRVRPETVGRFERPDQSSEQHPWDDLTDGVDPTDR